MTRAGVVLTARLRLEPLDPAHLDAVHAVYSDPATWTHLPAGVFTDPERTRTLIESSVTSRERSGLGGWAVRLRGPGRRAGAGPVVGTAGCTLLPFPAWNLGYRLAPAVWGHGYATEAAAAALAAARSAAPDTPVTARALTSNPASVRVLERAGLTVVWRGASTETELADPAGTLGLERVIATDRPVERDVLAALIDLG